MKKILVLLIVPVILFSCKQESGYKIQGNIEGLENADVYLKIEKERDWVAVDTVKAENGEFMIEGKLDAPEMTVLTFGETGSANLFLENSEIQITGHIDSLQSIEVTGSQAHSEFLSYRQKVAQYDEEMAKLYQEYQAQRKEGNKEKMKEIEKEYQAVSDNKMEFVKQFVQDRTESAVSPYIASKQLMPYMEYEDLDTLYNSLSELVKQTKYAQTIKDRKDVLERVQVGKEFIDFTLPDTEGNDVTFSNYIGDGYVLLDFWAAWCNPCRKENPNLVAAYEKYQDKGFEIFGVSLDRKKEDWLKAIDTDNITWPQVSDLKGWNNPTRKKYGVMAIPANFLINEEGIIVAKDLRGEELDAKLKEIYNK